MILGLLEKLGSALASLTFSVQHWLVRVYGAAHVVLAYVLLVLKMPDFAGYLDLHSRKPVLQALGLWEVSIHGTMPPLIGLIILVSVKLDILSSLGLLVTTKAAQQF